MSFDSRGSGAGGGFGFRRTYSDVAISSSSSPSLGRGSPGRAASNFEGPVYNFRDGGGGGPPHSKNRPLCYRSSSETSLRRIGPGEPGGFFWGGGGKGNLARKGDRNA